ncbi:MAG: protein kinase [Polyangiaceae bacterium]
MTSDENRRAKNFSHRGDATPADAKFVPPVSRGQVLLDKYRIEELIGTGGIGFVMSATNIGLEERVALKFLRPEFISNEEAVRRFTNEARLAAKLQSPHVTRVLDITSAEGVGPFIVMELLEGRDLNQILYEEGALPVERAVDYVLQACDALSAAHSRNIVHRDVKPDNLFLARQQQGADVIKILDFGISKLQADSKAGVRNPAMFQTVTALGSPSYMSPEQIRASADIDGRADVWSLGCVLYELLTAKHAFDAPTLMQVCAVVLERQPPPLRTHVPGVPAELEAIVLRCLEKAPEARFASVQELARALAPFASQPTREALGLSERSSEAPRLPSPPAVPTLHPPGIDTRSPPPSTAPMALERASAHPAAQRARNYAAPPLREIAAYAMLAAGIGIVGGLLVRTLGNSSARVASAPTTQGEPRASVHAALPAPAPVAVESLPVSTAEDGARTPSKARARAAWIAPVAEAASAAMLAPSDAQAANAEAHDSALIDRAADSTAEAAPNNAAPASASVSSGLLPRTDALAPTPAPQPAAPARAPVVAAPATQIRSEPARLSAQTVSSVVRAHAYDIHACFERAHADYDSLKGKLAIAAVLDKSGTVVDARTSMPLVDNPRLASCLVSAAKHWKFPERPGPAGLTTYRLVLE